MTTIRDVTAYGLSAPFPEPRSFEFEGGVRRIYKRDSVLVELVTSDGAVGYAPVGASSSAMREYFQDATQDNLTEVINTIVGPTVEGKPVEDLDRVHDAIYDINIPSFLQSQAASAVDIAIFDVVGKQRGAPIYDLLLDRLDADWTPTTELPLYASAGMYMPPDDYVAEAESLRDAGFSAYKYRPGRGVEEDLRAFDRLSSAVGDEMELMVDAHTWWKMDDRSYEYEDVRHLTQTFTEGGAYWIEEPVAPDALSRYRDLSETTDAALACGENAESAAELVDLAEMGCIDYLQGDVRHHQGYTGCLDALRHTLDTDVTFVPHNFGTNLGLVANAHLVAASHETPYLEYPAYTTEAHKGMYPYPLSAEILDAPLDVSDGSLTMPDDPGLGVTVNRDVIEDYPYVEGPWTEFVYS